MSSLPQAPPEIPAPVSGAGVEQNILLIRLGGFGDVLFTLPAVHLVRKSCPQARLSYLVAKEWVPLLSGFPGIESTLVLDRALYKRKNPLSICRATLFLLRALRTGRFSLAIDFHGFGETAFLTWWTRAAERWGSVYRPSRSWAYTRPIPRKTGLHAIDYHLDFLYECGLPRSEIRNEFALPSSADQEARQFLAQAKLDPARPILFIQALTSSPHKNWPLERYLALARGWKERGRQILFGGGPGDVAALEPARREGFSICASQSLLSTAGLVKFSQLVVGGNTGLLHLAVALDKPVVMIMNTTGPENCPPYGQSEWTVVPPPGEPLSSIELPAVEAACARALNASELTCFKSEGRS